MKKAIRILCAAPVILSLCLTAFANEFSVGIAFDSDVIHSGENGYEIYGKTGGDAQSIQVIRNYYKDGVFEKSEYGNAYTAEANQDFTYSESFSAKEGESVELFLTSGADNSLALSPKYGSGSTAFEYSLDCDCSTSAGIYDKNGVLVRTLWSAKDETAGNKIGIWDGKDDYGNYMADGSYTAQILSSNVKYDFDCIVGNNTKTESNFSNMSNYYPISDMTYANGKMYYAEQYTETSTMWRRFDVSDPHKVAGYITGQNKTSMRCTTDGEMVYWLNFQPLAESETGDEIPKMFVAALDISSNKEVVFENGISLWRSKIQSPVKRFQSAVGIENYSEYSTYYNGDMMNFNADGMGLFVVWSDENFFGDIAVTKENLYLAATFPKREYVKIMNKYTGAVICENAVSNPTLLAYDNIGRLWVVSGDSAELSLYSIAETGEMTKIQTAPDSVMLDEILGMEVSPGGSTMALIYGGETNKVVGYDLSDWSVKWTYGSGESYEESPEVKDDKLLFRGSYSATGNAQADYSYAAFEDENTLWFGEPGNRRNFKLDLSTGTPIIADKIEMRAVEYHVAVDKGDPERVFGRYLEYEIDYTKDGSDCWKLKNNWMFFTEPYIKKASTAQYMDCVTTLQNGKTYFLAMDKDGVQWIYELTDTGIRNTGIEATGYNMLQDGECTLQKTAYVVADNGKEKGIFQRYITGFDGDNPVYSDDVFLGYIPQEETGSYSFQYPVGISEDGLAVLINPSGHKNLLTDDRVDMRLAAVRLSQSYGDFSWKWKTARATPYGYKDNFPRDGAFEMNSSNTAQSAKFYGKNIIMQYFGEGYRGVQTNIFYHFYDNGLLVGVYGNAMKQQTEYENYGQELVNGNGFGWQIVDSPTEPGTSYIYQAGEARLSGIIRTKVTGLDTIKIITVPLVYKNGILNGAVLSEYKSDNFVSTNAKESLVSGFKCSVLSGYANLKGYIEKPEDASEKLKLWFYTDGEAKVTIEDKVMMSGSGYGCCTPDFKPGRRYFISADIKGSTFRLLYERSDGSKADFPIDHIYNKAGGNTVKVSENNLLENIPYSTTDKSLMTGWNFDIDDSLTHAVSSNRYNYDITEDNDLNISVNTNKDTSYEVTRDLGEQESFADAWELDADMIYFGYPTGQYYEGELRAGNIERYMDILDTNGKIIARFYVSYEDYSPYGNGTKIKSLEKPKSYMALDCRYLHELAVPFELKIVGADGKISFTFNQSTITADIFESGADWKSPKTLRLGTSQTANITANTEYVFKKLMFNRYDSDYIKTVSFYDENENLICVRKVRKNTAVKPPSLNREGFIITWNKDLSCVTGDMTVTAVAAPDTTPYKVAFYDENDNLIETKAAVYGTEITPPDAEKEGYRLNWVTKDGGMPGFVYRTSDIEVYARYERIRSMQEDFSSFVITQPSYNLQGDKIKSGSIASASGMTFYANDSAYKVMSVEDGCLFMEGQNISNYSPNNLHMYFERFESGKITVGFRFKALNYTTVANSNYDFGSLYDSNGRCVAKIVAGKDGLYIYDGKLLDTLLTKDTRGWHDVKYEVNLESKTFKIMFDNANIGEYDFYDKKAENVNSLYFAGVSTSAVSVNAMNWYMSNIYIQN